MKRVPAAMNTLKRMRASIFIKKCSLQFLLFQGTEFNTPLRSSSSIGYYRQFFRSPDIFTKKTENLTGWQLFCLYRA